jgi:hypothetical protein
MVLCNTVIHHKFGIQQLCSHHDKGDITHNPSNFTYYRNEAILLIGKDVNAILIQLSFVTCTTTTSQPMQKHITVYINFVHQFGAPEGA